MSGCRPYAAVLPEARMQNSGYYGLHRYRAACRCGWTGAPACRPDRAKEEAAAHAGRGVLLWACDPGRLFLVRSVRP